MENIANGGSGAFIIHTFINFVKPLIPENKKGWIPVLSILMGVLYAFLTMEWTIEMKIVYGIGIGSTPVASHEGSKALVKEEDLEFPQELYQ